MKQVLSGILMMMAAYLAVGAIDQHAEQSDQQIQISINTLGGK